jgi:pyridinium-3,5-biscarboxylic acid mononucleotide sulfurtransferase
VRSPLDEAGLTKNDIRELSRRAGLPTWDEPASACLSSRIPYFSEVTDEKLRMIERAENVLRDMGFRICRVRHHDTIARLELGRDETARALEPHTAEIIDRELRAIGYAHVTVDLRGYRLGSLNDALRLREV